MTRSKIIVVANSVELATKDIVEIDEGDNSDEQRIEVMPVLRRQGKNGL